MCGILGNIKNKNLIDNKDLNYLLNLNETQTRRGPDNTGYYLHNNKKIFFGHSRLSIIDLTDNAKQPMQSSNERYVLTYNGEIYNFKELANKIKFKDRDKLRSDTKVLLEYLSIHGINKALSDINGMYAISIYDKKENKLYLARDFFGKKPIYYYFDEEQIFFASTLKPIILNENIKKNIDFKSLDHYFNYGYCPNELSIFKNINKVSRNSLISFDLNSWTKNVEQIYKSKKINNFKSSINLKYLDELLYKSVEKRFISDVPISILLSSGIDSSLVSYYASIINKNIDTFTVGFEETEFDESRFSKKIASYYGLNNHTILFNKKDLKDIIYDIPDAFDEPFADSSQIPTMLIFKKISEYSKVCITGDGGDEIFYGYNRYQWFLIWKIFFEKNILVNKRSKSLVNKLVNLTESTILGNKIFNKFNLTSNKTQKFINIFFEKKNIYQKFIKLSFSNNFTYLDEKSIHNELRSLSQLRSYDIDNYLSDDILTKVDRSSMHFSVEARSPLLDKNIFDYMSQSSIKDNIDIFSKKKILKKILKNKIPKKLISKSKKGFAVPLEKILYENLKLEIMNDLNNLKKDERLMQINFKTCETILNRFFNHNDYKFCYQIWAYYVFFKWFNKYKKFINN